MKKREFNYPDKDDQVEGWQMTFSSLSLILVVVFVMLVSYSVADKRKIEHLKGTVKREAGEGNGRKIDRKNNGTANVEDYNDGAWINNAINSLGNSGAAFGLQNDVAVQRYGSGIRLKFKSDAVFPFGSAKVSEKIYPYLDEISKIAVERDLFLRVEGHTDDLPINTKEFPSNWELSTKRAVNIVRYFIEVKGLSAECLSAEGFGQYHRVVSGTGPKERSQNRRIEIYIEPCGKSVAGRDKSHEQNSK